MSPCSRVAIGIDIGTSWCKIAVDLVAAKNRGSGPKCFRNGPLLYSFPTLISYQHGRVVSWGLGAANTPGKLQDSVCCSDFVWQLCSTLKNRSESEPKRREPLWEYRDAKFPKLLDEIVVDYLKCIYTKLEQDSAADGWSKSICEWIFVFSIPGCFSIADKKHFDEIIKMWNTKEKHSYMILRQFEAASIYAIKAVRRVGDPMVYSWTEHLKQGNDSHAFLLADVGSVKAEVSSFFLKGVAPRVRLKRTPVPLNWDNCGSDTIDHAFEDYLREGIRPRSGKQKFEYSEDERKTKESFTRRKDLLKKRLDPTEPFTVPLFGHGVGHKDKQNVNGQPALELREEQIEGFFTMAVEKTVNQITKHLTQAKDQKIDIKFVVLVGGLASSAIFVRKVKERVLIPYKIPVWSPQQPEYAVAQGSIMNFQQWPYMDRNSSRASYCLVNKDGSFNWFYNRGDSYRDKKIRHFSLPINLKKRVDLLDFTIIRDTREFGRMPKNKKEILCPDKCEFHPFWVDIKDIPFDEKPRNQITRLFKPPKFGKDFQLRFEVKNMELIFRLVYDDNKEITVGVIDDMQ